MKAVQTITISIKGPGDVEIVVGGRTDLTIGEGYFKDKARMLFFGLRGLLESLDNKEEPTDGATDGS